MILKTIGAIFGIYCIYVWYHAIVTPDSCKELLKNTEVHYKNMGASKQFLDGIMAQNKEKIDSAGIFKDEFCKSILNK